MRPLWRTGSWPLLQSMHSVGSASCPTSPIRHHKMHNATQKTRGKFSRQALPNPHEYYEKQGIRLSGGGIWRDAICPFHTDTKPSLRVNIERGSFRCMACGAHGGDVLAYQMQKHKQGFVEACKQLGAWVEGSK